MEMDSQKPADQSCNYHIVVDVDDEKQVSEYTVSFDVQTDSASEAVLLVDGEQMPLTQPVPLIDLQ